MADNPANNLTRYGINLAKNRFQEAAEASNENNTSNEEVYPTLMNYDYSYIKESLLLSLKTSINKYSSPIITRSDSELNSDNTKIRTKIIDYLKFYINELPIYTIMQPSVINTIGTLINADPICLGFTFTLRGCFRNILGLNDKKYHELIDALIVYNLFIPDRSGKQESNSILNKETYAQIYSKANTDFKPFLLSNDFLLPLLMVSMYLTNEDIRDL